MSVIGPGNLGAINLAGSLAGGIRGSSAESDRIAEAASQRSADAGLKSLSSKSLEDVEQPDQSADRDADGRTPWMLAGGDASDDPTEEGVSDETEADSPRARPVDADGVLGQRIDLDA